MYIVTLVNEPPIISYAGGIANIPATDPSLQPRTGGRQKLDSSAPNVKAYQKHLETSQDAILRTVAADPAAVKLYR